MELWKALRSGIRSTYDGSEWTIGKWRTEAAPTEECVGFNASPRIIDAMQYVLLEVLARVEVDGVIIKSRDKWTCEKMRVVEAWEWTKEESVKLAIFAAELVLVNFEQKYPNDDRPRKAIEAARYWLEHQNDSARIEARRAAWSAESAASSANAAAARIATSAAWSTSAWSAENAASSAWSASSAAARSAASAAVENAASSENVAESVWSAARSAASAAWSAASMSAWSASAWSAASAASAAILQQVENYIQSRIPYLKKIEGVKNGVG